MANKKQRPVIYLTISIFCLLVITCAVCVVYLKERDAYKRESEMYKEMFTQSSRQLQQVHERYLESLRYIPNQAGPVDIYPLPFPPASGITWDSYFDCDFVYTTNGLAC